MQKIIICSSKKIMVILAAILFTVLIITFTAPEKIYAAETSGAWTYEVSGENATIVEYNFTLGGVRVEIPSTLGGKTVTSIGGSAFLDCTSLTSVIIPNSVTSIQTAAFKNCTSLVSVIIPNSVTSIKTGAFDCCTSLASVTIPNSVTSIGELAFHNCTSLTSITFNSATTGIYDDQRTISATAKIIGHDPSTAKAYATKYGRTFETIGGALPSTPPRALTPQELILQNLTLGQQANLYGSNTTGFVKTLYDNILGRVSDEEGLSDWTEALNNDAIPLSDVVYNFVFSKELEPMISSVGPEEFISFLYENVLNRNSDPEGYSGWISAMRNGMTKEEVLLHFIDSDEFKNIFKIFRL